MPRIVRLARILLPNTVHIGLSTVLRRRRQQTREEKDRGREGSEGRSIHRGLESGSFGPPRFADRRANPLGSLQVHPFAVSRPHRDLAPPSRGLPTRDSISAPQCASTSCAVNRDAVGKDAVARRCRGSLPPPFAARCCCFAVPAALSSRSSSLVGSKLVPCSTRKIALHEGHKERDRKGGRLGFRFAPPQPCSQAQQGQGGLFRM